MKNVHRPNAVSYSIYTRNVPILTRDVPILRYAFNQTIIDIYDKCCNINLSASEREYAQCTAHSYQDEYKLMSTVENSIAIAWGVEIINK